MANSVLDWVWDHSRSRHGSRLVLLSLADSTNQPGGWTWPSNAELMRRTGLGERAVQSAVIDLAKLGEVEVEYNGGPRGCNRYRILLTPADIAGVQKVRGAKTAGRRKPSKKAPPQASGTTPADIAPPAESAPPQISTLDPAISAHGTVKEPKEQPPTEVAGKHAVADQLAAAFWEHHQSSTAQTFIAIRQVIRTAIANGLARNDVARALDHLAREGRAISGGTITTAIAQMKHPNGSRPGAIPLPAGISPRQEHRMRR